MDGSGNIFVAFLGAAGAVVASFFTAHATASRRMGEVETDLAVLTERQELQYREVKDSLSRMEGKLDKALR